MEWYLRGEKTKNPGRFIFLFYFRISRRYKVTEAGPIIGNECLEAFRERASPGWAPRSRRVSLEPWTRQKILVLTTTPSLLAACAPRQTAAMPSRRYLSTGNSWSNHHRCRAVYMHTVRNGTEQNARDLLQVLSWRGNKWPGLHVYARVPGIYSGERIKVRIFSSPFPRALDRGTSSATRRRGTVSNFREAPRSWILACECRRPLTPTGHGSRARKVLAEDTAAPGRGLLSCCTSRCAGRATAFSM